MADITLSVSAAQINTAGQQTHQHSNNAVLDSFGESNGQPTYNGESIKSEQEITPETRVSGISDGKLLGVSDGMIAEMDPSASGAITPDTPISGFAPGMQLMTGTDGNLTEAKDGGSFYNRDIWLFGDSVTAVGTWWNALTNLAAARSISNFAVSGATWRDKSSTVLDGNPTEASPASNTIPNQVQKAINNISTYPVPEIVIFFAGLNDAWGTPYSTDDIDQYYISGESYIPISELDRTNMPSAIRYCVETVRGLYPYTQVILVAPYQTAIGVRDYAIIKSIHDVIEESALRLGTPCADLLKNSGISGALESAGAQGRYLADGLHPNGEGRDMVGLRILDVVKSLSFPYRELSEKINVLPNSDFTSGWNGGASSTLSASGGVLTQTMSAAYNTSLIVLRYTPVSYTTGHKYYMRVTLQSDLYNLDIFKALWLTTNPSNSYTAQLTTKFEGWLIYSIIVTAASDYNQFTILTQFTAATTVPAGHILQYKEPMLLDLTAIYGAGTEPSARYLDSQIKFFSGTA